MRNFKAQADYIYGFIVKVTKGEDLWPWGFDPVIHRLFPTRFIYENEPFHSSA